MIKKYWYEEGMCKYMGYKGQWPVAYISTDGIMYKKDHMACKEVKNGTCKLGVDCDVFKSAENEMGAHWQLRDKTMN